jgi:enterochelin esterase family protein
MPQVTALEGGEVVWRLPITEDEPDRVRLWSDFDLGDTSFQRGDCGWELRLPIQQLPPVDRLEYLFEVTRGDETASVLDPGNPRRVGGAFGDHSWLSLGYQPPAWLDIEPVRGERQRRIVRRTPVGDVDVEIWAPVGTKPDDQLPLLLSHDGPEMDHLGELTRYVGAMIALRQTQGTKGADGTTGAGGTTADDTSGLPPMRVGLLAPGSRDERYAANPAYAEALCQHVLPAVLDIAATAGQPPVLMGQSLGAVAALHAEWTHPGTFAGLFLQSGSFFTPELDAQESGYAHWKPVTTFVAEVLQAKEAPSTPPSAVGFGTAEENAANNRQLAAKLAALGCPVTVGEVRDGHTFTCWRDLLDPHLTDLLRRI